MGVELPLALTSLLTKLPNGSSFHLLGDQKHGLVYPVLVAISAIFVASTIARIYNGLKTVNYMPGFRRPFSPFSFVGVSFPESWWNPGYHFLWKSRHTIYKEFNSEFFSYIPWFSGPPMVITSNLEVLRQIAYGSHRTDFEKPQEMSLALSYWGQNIVSADGDHWRRHRRVVGPAFGNKLYQHVWTKTAEIYQEMLEAEGWTNKDVVEVEAVQKLTFQVALLAISNCGFGLPFSWAEPPASPDGSMTIRNALQIINERSMIITFLPRWILYIPLKYFREIKVAVSQMMNFMKEQVRARKESVNSGGGEDVFTLMVKANEEDGAKHALNESELIGNVFVMLFAGHETTAHTLGATLAFLAINPEIQQDILEHILSVVGDRQPIFEDYNKLDKVLAVFYEALRLFPSGHLMFRQATKDTVLQIPRPIGQEGNDTIAVPKGGMVVMDMVGVQYNPRYFDEPTAFKPSRWYSTSSASTDPDAFTAFSVGPRECLGRKFATTEAVSFLTLLIRDWKLEPFMRPGEKPDQWKARVLDAQLLITLGVKDAPIRFVRRQKR